MRTLHKQIQSFGAWRIYAKYAMIFSISVVGFTLVSTANSKKQKITEEEKENKDYKNGNDTDMSLFKAHQLLMETIKPPSHSSIVWIWMFCKRLSFLFFNFGPMLMLAPFAYANIFNIREYWLKLMRNSFANAGSTFIKIGQWISMRGDLFPIEICEYLSDLRFCT